MECARCSRPLNDERLACIYCGTPLLGAPRRTMRSRRHFVALLPGQASSRGASALALALDTSYYEAQQLLRRPVPVVLDSRRLEVVPDAERVLTDAGFASVRFTQDDLDAVPSPVVLRTLTVGAPGEVGGSPYRTGVTGYFDAVDVGGDERRVWLRDLRVAVVGGIGRARDRRMVIDLYGALATPLRLLTQHSSVRGLGVKDYERTAALSRFAHWLPSAAPHVVIDRGFRFAYGARRAVRDWNRWSAQTWVIHARTPSRRRHALGA